MFGTIFNLANAIIGAGVLVLPFAMQSLGLPQGCLLICMSAVCSALSCAILFHCARVTGAPFSYAEIGSHLLGRRFGAFVEFCSCAYSLGSCIGYLVIIESELVKVVDWVHVFVSPASEGEVATWWSSRKLLTAIVLIGAVLPLSSVRSLHALRYSSLGALVCVAYVLAILAHRVWLLDASEPSGWPAPSAPPLPGFSPPSPPRLLAELPALAASWAGEGRSAMDGFKMAPLLVFAFNCQVPFLPLVAEMPQPTWPRVSRALAITFASTLALYLAIATLGFVGFGQGAVAPNILDSFSNSDSLAVLARMAMIIVLVTSFPLYAFAIRLALGRLLLRTEDVPPLPHFALTALIVLGCGAVSMGFTSLEVPLGLTGSLGGTCLVFILPAACLATVEMRALIGASLAQPEPIASAAERTSGGGAAADNGTPDGLALALLDGPNRSQRRRRRAHVRLLLAAVFCVCGACTGVLGTVATLIPLTP